MLLVRRRAGQRPRRPACSCPRPSSVTRRCWSSTGRCSDSRRAAGRRPTPCTAEGVSERTGCTSSCRSSRIDLIVPENALSIPMHVPLGMAITELIAETGIPTIAHHHDFYWERPALPDERLPGHPRTWPFRRTCPPSATWSSTRWPRPSWPPAGASPPPSSQRHGLRQKASGRPRAGGSFRTGHGLRRRTTSSSCSRRGWSSARASSRPSTSSSS